VLKNLDAMLTRMRGVKRKLTAYAEEESRLHLQTAARITHLDELYSIDAVEDVKYEAWSRKRLDRLLADYLLRHGFNQTAADLAAEKGLSNLVDVDTFVGMSHIRESLLNGSVAEALAWCTENKKELRKMEVRTTSQYISSLASCLNNTYRANSNSCCGCSSTSNSSAPSRSPS